MPTQVFSDALEGMEIAVPPSSGNIEQETDEYGRSSDRITRRPLPPTPPPRIPPRSIARKPVPSQRRVSTPDTSNQRQPSTHAIYGYKSLPPEPLEVRYSSAMRRRIAPNQPTGHRSSRKISRLMGAEVNVFTESPAIKSAPICSAESSTSSLYSTGEKWTSFRRNTVEAPSLIGGHRLSDTEAIHQYHRILESTADDREVTSPYRHGCGNQYTTRSEPQRLHGGQLDPRSQHVCGNPRGQQPVRRVSPGWGRPTSAFDSDSDDNKVSSVWGEIKKLVRPKSGL